MDVSYSWGTPENRRVCQECAKYLSPMTVDVIITHQNCMDGELSAALMTMHRIAKPRVLYIHPGTPLSQSVIDECMYRRVLMVDVAPPPRDYDMLESVCSRFAVLDHHEINKRYAMKPSFFYVDKLCGASAMFYYMSTRVTIDDPLTLQVIDTVHQHDLWSFTGSPSTQQAKKIWARALQKTMHDHPNRAELMRSVCLNKQAYRDIVEQGRRLAPLIEKAIASMQEIVELRVIRDTHVLVIDITSIPNARNAINECGHNLSMDTKYPVCFVRRRANVCVSCRGCGALEFAEKFKGGGHKQAAGFQLSMAEAEKEGFF